MGLPLPALNLEIDCDMREIEAVKSMDAFVTEVAVQEQVDLTPIESWLNGQEQEQERLMQLRENLIGSNRAVIQLMETIDK